MLIAVSMFERSSGLAVFALPESVPVLRPGTVRLQMVSSDYQEAKNVDTIGPSIMPNTRTASARVRIVNGVTVNWLLPESGTCAKNPQRLAVVASAPGRVTSVRYVVDGKRVAVVREGDLGVWTAHVSLARGSHVAVATAVGLQGDFASARRTVRVCRG
jgi:hypothetical protein